MEQAGTLLFLGSSARVGFQTIERTHGLETHVKSA